MLNLADRCMYAAFGEAVQKKGQFIIQRRLTSCEQAFTNAKKNRLSFEILFADASFDSSTIISWAIVNKISFDGKQTTVEFSPVTLLATPVRVSKLKKVADGKPISAFVRRGQILCDTPSFIKRVILEHPQTPTQSRAEIAYLFLWKPEKDPDSFADYDHVMRNAASGRSYTTRWRCRAAKPRPYDIAIMQRTGSKNNGVFATGVVTRAHYVDEDGTPLVDLKLDSFLPFDSEISRKEIVSLANYKKKWTPMASGNVVPPLLLHAIQSLWAARSRNSAKQLPDYSTTTNSGGFGSYEENKKVETVAMSFVSRWYLKKGWQVTDVSAECLGYDLNCIKGRQIAHVEVKGSSGIDRKFIITANEMRAWEADPSFVLTLVTNVKNKPDLHQFIGAQAMKSLQFTALSYMAEPLH